MKELTIAPVQFESAENNKQKNIETMTKFVVDAAKKNAQIISFPEYCTTAWYYFTKLTKNELLDIAENAEDGLTALHFIFLAKTYNITIMYGLLEKTKNDELYNAYVVITPENGFYYKFRKVHAFENSAIRQGDKLEVFDLYGWTMSILTCYDNNIPENNRVVALKGAEIIFAPHRTGGFNNSTAGMGLIDHDLWKNRELDPKPIRKEILGLKGREWVMKWLPSRSYDNNVFTVFSNSIGIDGEEVSTGCSMIIDPNGIVKAECDKLGDDMVIATIDKNERFNNLSANHFLARRPSLYQEISAPREERPTIELYNLSHENEIR